MQTRIPLPENKDELFVLSENINNLLNRVENAIEREKQFTSDGFEWISLDDSENSVISFIRKGNNENVAVICNFTPATLEKYKVGIPKKCKLKEIFSSDDKKYGGSGVTNTSLTVKKSPWNGRDYSVELTLPPLGITILELKQ
mgnify:CR=1 FL=1